MDRPDAGGCQKVVVGVRAEPTQDRAAALV
jgi:hypothetical protein